MDYIWISICTMPFTPILVQAGSRMPGVVSVSDYKLTEA
jgi:hypothetical protein